MQLHACIWYKFSFLWGWNRDRLSSVFPRQVTPYIPSGTLPSRRAASHKWEESKYYDVMTWGKEGTRMMYVYNRV